MKRTLLGIVIAVLMLLAATALGLGFIHLTGFPYAADLDALDIPAASGVSREEARANYDAVMKFLSPFSDDAFSLPTFAWSTDGAAHFEDCKVIFNGVYLAGGLAALMLVLIGLFGGYRDRRTLRVSGTATLAIPLLLFAAVAIDFDGAFVLFHTVFFPGATNWIFDAAVDPIITILPAEFFLHCALVIAAFWLLASLLQFMRAPRRQKGLKAYGME